MPLILRPEWRALLRHAWAFDQGILAPDLGYCGAQDGSKAAHLTSVARSSDYTHSVSNSNGRAGLAGIAGSSSASKGAYSGTNVVISGSEITLLAWFTAPSFVQTDESAFIRKTDSSTGQGAALGYFASTKTFRPLLSTSGTTGWTAANDRADSRLTAGVPWFVAMRYKDGQRIRVYSGPAGVGGDTITLLGSVTSTSGPITNTSGPPYLGGMIATAASTPIEATLHFVGATDIALSEEQIKAIGCAPDAIFEPRRIWVPVSAGGGTQTGAGSSAGVASVSGVGDSTYNTAGASTGTATATSVGASTANATAAAAGTSTATAVSQATSTGVGSSAGTSTATAVGESTNTAAGAATATGTVSGVGASTHDAVGAATGTASASATAAVEGNYGAATGTATATAAGAATTAAPGTATGTATVFGYAATTETGVGAAAGTSTVTGVSYTDASGPADSVCFVPADYNLVLVPADFNTVVVAADVSVIIASNR